MQKNDKEFFCIEKHASYHIRKNYCKWQSECTGSTKNVQLVNLFHTLHMDLKNSDGVDEVKSQRMTKNASGLNEHIPREKDK